MIRWLRIIIRKAQGQSLAEQGIITWTEQQVGQSIAQAQEQRPKSNASLLRRGRRNNDNGSNK